MNFSNIKCVIPIDHSRNETLTHQAFFLPKLVGNGFIERFHPGFHHPKLHRGSRFHQVHWNFWQGGRWGSQVANFSQLGGRGGELWLPRPIDWHSCAAFQNNKEKTHIAASSHVLHHHGFVVTLPFVVTPALTCPLQHLIRSYACSSAAMTRSAHQVGSIQIRLQGKVQWVLPAWYCGSDLSMRNDQCREPESSVWRGPKTWM